MTRDQNDDVHVLRRMLTVPAERDFPADRRQQREEHLMSSWLQLAREQDKTRRRRLAVRVMAPVAVAAAVAGIAVTANQTGTPTGRDAPARHTAPEAGHFPERINTVAYTLNREPHGVVKVTIRDIGEMKPDPERLQRDLARMGVRARVYQGDPDCPVNEGKTTSGDESRDDHLALKVVQFESEGGRFTASIHPDRIPADHTLVIIFPVATTDTGVDEVAFDVIEAEGPDCWHMPAPGARDEDYVVGGDGRMRWVPPSGAAKH
ncbi:hypothetical protein [Streptomyces sp. 2A115]|uniref:hypothetical protein n=1 Tax=Streptomyces sp. 2A115 TaxID=3457439 RepID=UPI003FD1A0C4